MTKEIDVTGYRYYDLVLYLSGLLEAMGERVYVRDMSEEATLFEYIPSVEGLSEEDILELRGVSFLKGQKDIAEDCTYCFNLWENPEWAGYTEQKTKAGGFRLFVTDEEPKHEKKVDRSVRLSAGLSGDNGSNSSALVIRDYTGISDRNYYQISDDLRRSNVFKLPYSEKDRKAELYLAVREDVTVRTVSEKMGSLLEELVHKIRPQTAAGEFDRAYKIAMKGGLR